VTPLGEYLIQKSVKKADVSRKTGISTSRLTELTRNEKTKLKAEEAYLIALAIDVEPGEILEKVFANLKLKKVKNEKR
jgi:DNA-binding Xre family transcriptional regulator